MYLVLDIGTSDIKCGCIDSENNIIVRHHRQFPLEKNENSFEIDFELFFDTTKEVIKECLFDDSVKNNIVEALLITSQAQTFTAVDKDFSPLMKGIVWLDERAIKEADFLKEELTDFSASAGFSYPLKSQYISKLLWLKWNKPLIFEKSTAFPHIYEFLVYKLTGFFYSDKTSFGMSGMYDYRYNKLNDKLLAILDLDENYFPIIEDAGIRGEMISLEMLNEFGIENKFPVFLCGNDQSASAYGAGLRQTGDLNINFGTALVFYTITDTLVKDLTKDQIAGKHPFGSIYFLLNFESDFGIKIKYLKEQFFKNGTYDQLFQTYLAYPQSKEQEKIEIAKLNTLGLIESHKYCAGVIKYYLKKIKMHFEQIQKVVKINNITLSGGMMNSNIWLKILQDFMNKNLTVIKSDDAGMIGAIEIYLQNKEG